MRRAAIVLVLLTLSAAAAEAQTTKLRVAICARTITMGVGSPFAVAMKMGWFKQEGLEIDIVPLPGSTDCVKAVATGEVPVALPSVEQYALIENAGVRMRYLDRRQIERFPGNGFLASEETLRTRGRELIGLARAYAKGTIFTIANPEAAVHIVYELFPQTKPTGKDEATAVREDLKVLAARMPHYRLEPAGVKRWGESAEVNYRDYVDFLVKWSVITQKVPTGDLITNEMIEEINRMDAGKIAAEAAAYRYAR